MGELEEIKKTATLMIVSIAMIIISGIGMGFIYYAMDVTADHLEDVHCTIENNVFVSNCQELFNIGFYPFLALRTIVVALNIIFIIGLTAGILLLGYQSGKSPWTIGILIVLALILTYLSLHISNYYQDLLTNEIFYAAMLNFTVYNKIMLNLPWFVFIVSLISAMLSIVNYQKSPVNVSQEVLNY